MKTLMRHNTETGMLIIYQKYGQEFAVVEMNEPDAGKAHRLDIAIRRAEDAAFQAGARAVRAEVAEAIKKVVA